MLFNKHSGWLKRVRNKLADLDTNKVTINLADYSEVNENAIMGSINTATTKINSINADNLPNEVKNGRNTTQKFLFPNVPAINGAKDFKETLSLYYIWGKNAKSDPNQNKLTTYTGDAATTKINEMIEYCDKYFTMADKLGKQMDTLIKAAGDKQKAVNDSQKKDNTEQNQNQQNNDKTNLNRVLTDVCRDFMTGTMTACEKKYMDYMTVLKKISPESAEEHPDDKEKENGQKTEEKPAEGEQQQGESK